MNRFALTLAGGVLGLACGVASAQVEYDLVMVDAFTPTYDLRETYLWDLNDSGIGCGSTTIAVTSGGNTSITYTGFVWNLGEGKSVVPLAWPRGINNHGLVAGVGGVYDMTTGQITTVPGLPGTAGSAILLGVSDAGVAVGYVQTCICSNSQGRLQIPYVWSGASGARTLAVPGATGAGRVNSAGKVVGWIGGNSATDAFVYDLASGQYTLIGSLFPPMPNGWTPHATADDISENNLVAGSRLDVDATTTFGYIWHVGDAAATVLPQPGAGYAARVRPSGINNAGTVVGSISTTGGSSRAFVYDAARGLRDLNTLTTLPADFVLSGAYKVNEQGWIVGYGQGGGGFSKSFVLMPRITPCPADFNQSGAVTVQDVFDFLGAYFAGVPSADFSGSGGVSVQDIFDYLAAYFSSCP